MQKQVLKTLLNTAKGKELPDAVIRNGRLLNVFTNSIDEGLDVIVKDGWIVSAGESGNSRIPGGVREIDADGACLCPGFIDAHTHLDSIIPFYEFVPYALRGGTTAIVTECSCVACACGAAGVKTFIESTKGYPLRCYFTAPPLTPPFPKMESSYQLTLKEFNNLLKREDFLGIGEAYWTSIVEGDDRTLKQAAHAISMHKNLDGHAAGARGKRLVEYVLTGITSCHESVSIDEVIEKLKLGLYVMIREGWVRRELPELSKIKDIDVDKRRVMLVSDMFDAVMLYEEGYLDTIVRKAIEYGFSPIEAIKMVTINPADYYGLRHLGAIAPLRRADIIFLKDIKKISIEKVMVNGNIVYSNDNMTTDIKPYMYPGALQRTVSAEKLNENDFRIKAHPKDNTIRIIEVTNQTITKERQYNAAVKDGFLEKDIEHDIIPVAVINKRNNRKLGKSFIKGTGIKNGSVATTLIWDTTNILSIGSDEEDMTTAVNRLIDIQGGIVIAREGKVIYEFPMPVFGTIPIAGMKEIRDKTLELEEKMKEIGSLLERPFLTIQTIPFTGLPFLRITDKGLADIKNKRLVPLFIA
jgi:adenine deaminase